MLVGSAVALIFTGVSRAFCSPKEELLRLRGAGASQGVVFCLRARARRAWCAARSTSAPAGRRRAAAGRPGWQMRPSARLRWHLRRAGRFRPRCRTCEAPWSPTAAWAAASARGRRKEKEIAGSLRHAYGELAAPLAAHMVLGPFWAPHLSAHLYQCRGFFGARGYWLQLDGEAAAIWWAEEPPHDVHGPG